MDTHVDPANRTPFYTNVNGGSQLDDHDMRPILGTRSTMESRMGHPLVICCLRILWRRQWEAGCITTDERYNYRWVHQYVYDMRA